MTWPSKKGSCLEAALRSEQAGELEVHDDLSEDAAPRGGLDQDRGQEAEHRGAACEVVVGARG